MSLTNPTVYLVSVYNTAGIRIRLYTLVADSFSAAAEAIGERTPMAYMDGELPQWRDQHTGEPVDVHLGVAPVDTSTGRKMIRDRKLLRAIEDGVRRERELRLVKVINDLGVDTALYAIERLLEERKRADGIIERET